MRLRSLRSGVKMTFAHDTTAALVPAADLVNTQPGKANEAHRLPAPAELTKYLDPPHPLPPTPATACAGAPRPAAAAPGTAAPPPAPRGHPSRPSSTSRVGRPDAKSGPRLRRAVLPVASPST